MKIAIVHDFLNQYGGAERTLDAMHEAFPEAPIFTSIFLPENFPACFSEWDVRTSFMQRLPFLKNHFKKYLPLYPLVFSRFDLKGFDVILSSSSAFAKGISVPVGARHVCYCYSPMRFVWDRDRYLEKEPIPVFLKPLLSLVLGRLKSGISKRISGWTGSSGFRNTSENGFTPVMAGKRMFSTLRSRWILLTFPPNRGIIFSWFPG
ncbi:MAG: hypothetical protein IPP35_12505 [Elusimicrobia bacterium]|nr:hypothetical protein [Elusimicrobiota bacterium]